LQKLKEYLLNEKDSPEVSTHGNNPTQSINNG